MKSNVKTFNISFPKELADAIDKKAKEQFGSRSDFLRTAAIKYLRDEERVGEFKKLIKEFRKEVAKDIPYQSEEEVAEEITAERRKTRRWRPEDFKNRT